MVANGNSENHNLNTLNGYYKYIKDRSIKDKPKQIPSNMDSYISDVEHHTQSKNIHEKIMSMLYLLNHLFKYRKGANQTESGTKRDLSGELIKNKTYETKINSIPDRIKTSKDPIVRAAIALHIYPHKAIALRNIVVSICHGDFDNQTDIAELTMETSREITTKAMTVAMEVNQSKNMIDRVLYPIDNVTTKNLVTGILASAVMLKSKHYAEIAYVLDASKYKDYVQEASKTKDFNHLLIIVDPLTRRYLKDYISPVRVREEKQRIENQFSVNPVDALKFLYDTFEKESAITTNHATNTKNNIKFQDDYIYYVYKGSMNYPSKDLSVETITVNGQEYLCKILKHCLYDVIAINNVTTYNQSWPARLDSIDYRTKIVIETKTGRELNEEMASFHGTIGISWNEADQFKEAYYTFTKSSRKKRKMM